LSSDRRDRRGLNAILWITQGTVSGFLVWAGVVIALVSGVRLALARDSALRLHYVSPVTSLAAPLVIVGLVLHPWSSWHDVAKLAVIGVLLAGTGPATVVTAARARRRGDE
jgi:multisubunit Na+/H+ antiporter MnhG subunit